MPPATSYWQLDADSGGARATAATHVVRAYRLLLLLAALGISLWMIVHEFLRGRSPYGFGVSLFTIIASAAACVLLPRHLVAWFTADADRRLTALLVPPWTSGPVLLEVVLSIALGLVWWLQFFGDSTLIEFTVWTVMFAISTCHPASLPPLR
jgi:hypothetical protein